MTGKTAHSRSIWRFAREQRWAIATWQLVDLGLGRHAIRHRVDEGRLHRVHQGVYAVGRADLSREGKWIAALLACGWKHPNGPELIALSHHSGAANLAIARYRPCPISISLQAPNDRKPPGIEVHRRRLTPADITVRAGIPTTNPVLTLIDLAATVPQEDLEHAINEADRTNLISPPALLAALDLQPRRRGIRALSQTLIRYELQLPTTELERLFLPIAKRAGLPRPLTQQWVNGHKVDFFFPDLGLVVETDGLTYHRTPAQQAEDTRRDQDHELAGLSHMRFSHYEVRHEPAHVERTLAGIASRRRR